MTDYRRALVASQFHRARRRAAIESLLARLTGQSTDLLSFNEVVEKLGISGQSSLGLQQIPIGAIVGSVGRAQDFSRTFLPRLEMDEDRWVRVGAAAPTVADLPPIEVYQIGDVYFVLDGNHRVSLARAQALSYIDANVTEVRTRAPMPSGARPDDLIIAAELGAFLAYTRLDVLRPGADMQVSVPGQYRHLENHIEAHRFVLETDEERELSNEESVERWYDEVYLPLVEAIREQGILRYFPGRTETDFFIWLARHRADLQNELGYAITPDVTVARLLSRVEQTANGNRATLIARLRRLARRSLSEPTGSVRARTWAQERTLGRYSDHLFATMLYPIIISETDFRESLATEAFSRVVTLSREEGARLTVLGILDDPPTTFAAAAEESMHAEMMTLAPEARWLVEMGEPLHWIKEVGFLNDLVIIDHSFGTGSDSGSAPSITIRAVIDQVRRPILVTGSPLSESFPQRILVVHDTRRQLDEAIFIAAYLAERWRAELSILPLSNGRNTDEIVRNIGDYLGLHEVTASFLEPIRPNDRAADHVIGVGHNDNFDLILTTGPERGRRTSRNNNLSDIIWAILQGWPRSVMIAT